jgi:Tol biopolymer transport system component
LFQEGKRRARSSYEIWIMEADGSDQKKLVQDGSNSMDPAWSPDGRRIIFASLRGQRGYRLCIMDTDGKNVEEVANTSMGSSCPSWSPDSKNIAYVEAAPQASEIFSIAAGGANRKQLTALGGWNVCPAWSPDGKRIAFQHTELDGLNSSLYIMNSDGSNPKEILGTEGIPHKGRPAWKPR